MHTQHHPPVVSLPSVYPPVVCLRCAASPACNVSDVHLVVAAFEEFVSINNLGQVIGHHGRGFGQEKLDAPTQELVATVVQPAIVMGASLGDPGILDDVNRGL